MERSHRIAGKRGPLSALPVPSPGLLPSGRLAPVVTSAFALALLLTIVGLLAATRSPGSGWQHQDGGATTARPELPAPFKVALLGHGDTIDGHPVVDSAFIARIERFAARIPQDVLSDRPRDARIRYVAQAFTPGDDPGLTEGWFQDPAAALAFGCAVDDDASLACQAAGEDFLFVADAVDSPDMSADDRAPGWRCRPLGLAIGSPAFEPARCDAPG